MEPQHRHRTIAVLEDENLLLCDPDTCPPSLIRFFHTQLTVFQAVGDGWTEIFRDTIDFQNSFQPQVSQLSQVSQVSHEEGARR
jgi:hypothetical protein